MFGNTVKRVAEQLGNRPAICRKHYVHPGVIAAFLAGGLDLARLPSPPGSMSENEERTLALLRRLPHTEPSRRARRRRVAGKADRRA